MGDRRRFGATFTLLVLAHASVTFLASMIAKLDPPAWLRDPFGTFSVLTLYGPIALVTKLGAPRSTFEHAAWLFGAITPAGWMLVIASWLVVHALLAAIWTRWRR